jgi:hypothetical protein
VQRRPILHSSDNHSQQHLPSIISDVFKVKSGIKLQSQTNTARVKLALQRTSLEPTTMFALRRVQNARFHGLRTLSGAPSLESTYNRNSFSRSEQEKYVSGDALDEIDASIAAGTPVSPSAGDAFARGIMSWAQERGAR